MDFSCGLQDFRKILRFLYCMKAAFVVSYVTMSSFVVSQLFGDGMILQQGVPVPVWGETAPAMWVSVKFMGKLYRVKSNENGKWRVSMASQPCGGPYEMTISSSGKKKVFKDVYFGDVWVCSGQSNMEMPMQRLRDDFPEEWDAPINPLIRQFKVPQEWEFSGPRQSIAGGCWVAAAEKTLGEFSAAAWFFARKIFENNDVPIGLVNATWGGTPVEAWMSREALAAFPEKIAAGKKYENPLLRNTISRHSEAAIKAWNDALAIGDRGGAEQWQKPQPTVSQWGKVTLPGVFSKIGLDKFCGAVWFRRQIEANAELAQGSSKLWLGTIADTDTVYINGVEVGSSDSSCWPRKYAVPAGLLREGENWIVIRVVCGSSDGGISEGKGFRIFSDSESIELGGFWEYRVGIRAAKLCPAPFYFQRQPSTLFNAMIAPLVDYPCKGILWYQGESNADNAGEYKELFAAHISDWQSKWQTEEGSIPFIFVQLPIFGKPGENSESSSWAILREAQREALLLPSTGMAAALDLGEWDDIHPTNKKDVGCRLALAAEREASKNKNSAPGPLFRNMKHSQGRLLIRFDNCGKGLVAQETPHVTVIAEGKSHRLPAQIEGSDRLSVDISLAQNPEKLLYAWADNPRDRQLYNSDGLPAIPFRAEVPEPTQ